MASTIQTPPPSPPMRPGRPPRSFAGPVVLIIIGVLGLLSTMGVLELEQVGIYFSKDLSKSILYSIAAPGTSQHIAMLAFDVNEFEDSRVREIMSKHGWFQTVVSDLPHFTYLGLKEKDLPKNGLRSVEVNGQVFWIPNVAGNLHPGLDK